MNLLQTIRERLPHVLRQQQDELALCEQLIAQIEAHLLNPERGAWTFSRVSNWVGVAPTDERLQRCLELLASSRSLKLLNVQYLYFDPHDPDDIGTRLSAEEVNRLLRHGEYFDPESGEAVQDPREHVLPYFEPIPELLKATNG